MQRKVRTRFAPSPTGHLHIQKLRTSGFIYLCYCTSEELETRRKEMLERGESAHNDGRCRELSREQQNRLEDEGRKPAFRFWGMRNVGDLLIRLWDDE